MIVTIDLRSKGIESIDPRGEFPPLGRHSPGLTKPRMVFPVHPTKSGSSAPVALPPFDAVAPGVLPGVDAEEQDVAGGALPLLDPNELVAVVVAELPDFARLLAVAEGRR